MHCVGLRLILVLTCPVFPSLPNLFFVCLVVVSELSQLSLWQCALNPLRLCVCLWLLRVWLSIVCPYPWPLMTVSLFWLWSKSLTFWCYFRTQSCIKLAFGISCLIWHGKSEVPNDVAMRYEKLDGREMLRYVGKRRQQCIYNAAVKLWSRGIAWDAALDMSTQSFDAAMQLWPAWCHGPTWHSELFFLPVLLSQNLMVEMVSSAQNGV